MSRELEDPENAQDAHQPQRPVAPADDQLNVRWEDGDEIHQIQRPEEKLDALSGQQDAQEVFDREVYDNSYVELQCAEGASQLVRT